MRAVAALLAAVVCAACGGDDGAGDAACDAELVTDRIPEPPPAALEPLVRDCQMTLKACLKVCEAVQTAAGGTGTITRCMVTHDATGHDVTVGFTPPCSE